MGQSSGPIYSLAAYLVSQLNFPVAAAAKIWYGVAVCTDASGNANPGADTSGLVYQGQAGLTVDNTGGIAGAQVVPVENPQFVTFNAVSPTEAWVGTHVFLTDDHTVAQSSSNHVIVGTVVAVLNTTATGVVVVNTYAKSALATS